MKKIKYIMMAFVACLMASCMDGGYGDPDTENAYGTDIQETNVVTIANLKSMYSSTVFNSTNSYKEITTEMQIKGRVMGNDIGGNIYNEIAIDDGTGAILICISQGGLAGFLPVGQEILVDLKGLYIGGYGKQPEIGTPYTNKSGNTYVSRMSRYTWATHYKLIGTPDASKVVAEEFDVSKLKDQTYMEQNCGKLMTLKGVTLSGANGKKTYAPEDEKDAANCVARYIDGLSSSYMTLRTSTYADFAAKTLPTGTVNITGIFTRYRDCWQILMRSEADIEISY